MFDKVSRLAERAAVGLSRRSFLTGIGLGAMAFAAFVGQAMADRPACILNGGCCPAAWPYLGGRQCYKDYKCRLPSNVLCLQATCCGGAGYCFLGTICYSDACNTPC